MHKIFIVQYLLQVLTVSVLANILVWMTQFLAIFTRWKICIVVVKHNCKWMNVCSYNVEVPSSICIYTSILNGGLA